MTSRERIHAAFQHKEPDRTPIFEREIKPPTDRAILGRNAVSPWNWPEYMRFWAREGWEATMEQQARDEVEIVTKLGFDMIRLGTNPPRSEPKPVEIDRWTFRHGDSVLRYHSESGVVETVSPKAPSLSEQECEFRNMLDREYESPEITNDEFYVYRRSRELLREQGLDLAVYVSLYAIPVAALPVFALEWFVTEPETIERFYDRQTRHILDMGRAYIEEHADVIGLGGDFAGDTGPVISPAAYRELVVPQIRKQADDFHRSGVWTTNTTDGYLWDVLPDFLDGTGVDGYGEIDVAAGMDLARLKREWGDRYTFLGNLDIRHVLCGDSIIDAEEHMVRCIADGSGNGGHVIMTSNVVHEDVKPELYLAAIGAYRRHFGLPKLES